MKLGDGGEAFFVFETEGNVPSDLITSPVISPVGSPSHSPRPQTSPLSSSPEPEFLDLSKSRSRSPSPSYSSTEFTSESPDSPFLKHVPTDPILGGSATPPASSSELKRSGGFHPYSNLSRQFAAESLPDLNGRSKSPPISKEQAIERAQHLTKKLKDINIPSKITDNGEVVMDMTGYKSGEADIKQSEAVVKKILADEFGESSLNDLLKRDHEGHLTFFAGADENGNFPLDDMSSDYGDSLMGGGGANTPLEGGSSPIPIQRPNHAATFPQTNSSDSDDEEQQHEKVYAKTLRLTSEQLKSLNLKDGANDVSFTVVESKAKCEARMFYWSHDVPLVISDIDGTITKSDALGHVLAMIGRDWTHLGVGKLFTDIASNGYHIMYLTARSVGQADSTRLYLRGINQDGYKLPDGPVILSPDRTMAALRREVIMKKPEVFKMACLRDIKNLYGDSEDVTPFYAGFGNRITDALSYRSVGVPSSRIFTINPSGEVHLELLELSGYKSSYVSISDLVDHFFPPAGYFRGQETYTDLTYWREPIPDLSEFEPDSSSEDDNKPTDTLRSPNRRKDTISSINAGRGSIGFGGATSPTPSRSSTFFSTASSPPVPGSPPTNFEIRKGNDSVSEAASSVPEPISAAAETAADAARGTALAIGTAAAATTAATLQAASTVQRAVGQQDTVTSNEHSADSNNGDDIKGKQLPEHETDYKGKEQSEDEESSVKKSARSFLSSLSIRKDRSKVPAATPPPEDDVDNNVDDFDDNYFDDYGEDELYEDEIDAYGDYDDDEEYSEEDIDQDDEVDYENEDEDYSSNVDYDDEYSYEDEEEEGSYEGDEHSLKEEPSPSTKTATDKVDSSNDDEDNNNSNNNKNDDENEDENENENEDNKNANSDQSESNDTKDSDTQSAESKKDKEKEKEYEGFITAREALEKMNIGKE